MGEKKKFRIEFIIDQSGSMQPLTETVINGFNNQIKEMRDEEIKGNIEYSVSLTLFSTNVQTIFENRRMTEVPPLTVHNYTPDGLTALYDAVGSRIETAYTDETDVLVYIFTDGQNNNSVRFTAKQVATLVELRTKQGWNFVYFGANQNAWEVGSSLGIHNNVTYTANANSTARGFAATKGVRMAYVSNSLNGLEGALKSQNTCVDTDLTGDD